MGRSNATVKKIKIKGCNNDSAELNDMFEQMTGSQGADPEIIIPKAIKLRMLLNKYATIFNLLLNFDEFIKVFDEFDNEFNDIRTFTNELKSIVGEVELSQITLEQMSSKDVNELYKKMKENAIVQSIIISSSNLKNYKRYIEDKTDLKDEFIKREPGISFTPLNFTKLDLKTIWLSDKLTKMAKKFILNILHNTYVIGNSVYEIVTSPDIDIKKFSRVLIDNIDKIKKTVPRCDKAFNIIKNSVVLLEDNFKNYYKSSVEASNPSLIIESFIVDVSIKQKANATVTAQFRKIIMFMKKQSANNNDPRVKKLFKLLNTQFDLMEKPSGVVDETDETDETDEADETKE
jgi:hypothetical protein